MELGKKIKQLRTNKGVTQEALANALGVTTDELIGHDIEDDKMGFVRLKTVLARGMESMSEDDKKELIKFLLEN